MIPAVSLARVIFPRAVRAAARPKRRSQRRGPSSARTDLKIPPAHAPARRGAEDVHDRAGFSHRGGRGRSARWRSGRDAVRARRPALGARDARFMPNVDGTGEREPVGCVAVLEDTDGDGRYDKRTVFLDKLVLPRAISLVGDGCSSRSRRTCGFAATRMATACVTRKSKSRPTMATQQPRAQRQRPDVGDGQLDLLREFHRPLPLRGWREIHA